MRVQYDITTDCNLGCEICYLEANSSSIPAEVVAVDLRTYPSTSVIALGGGEPFQHPQLEEIVRDAINHGNPIHLATNATQVPVWFYGLPQKESILVQVSLLAASPEKYWRICGQNLLNQVKGNIQRLRDNYRTFIHSVIYKGNLGEVTGLLRISQQLKVPIHFGLVIPVGKARNVDLLDRNDIACLRDLLNPYIAIFDVSASFMNDATRCPVMAQHYPFQLQGSCLCDSLYVGPDYGVKHCVFGGG